MIENLVGLYETVNYKKDTQMRLQINDWYENFPPHWHTPFELIMPIKSTYTVRCCNTEYILQEGETIIICPGIIHELFSPPEGVRIVFQPAISQLPFQELDLIISRISPAVVISEKETPKIHDRIRQLMLEIQEEYFSSLPYAESAVYSKFLEILVLAGRHYLNAAHPNLKAPQHTRQKYMEKFLFICNHINEHFAEPLTLENTAAMAGFSKYHFSRLFRQYTDTTFYKYLNQKRIAHAKQLLLDNDLPVLEIAFQCGFSNLSSFLRMFKLLTGYTPSELLKMYRGDF